MNTHIFQIKIITPCSGLNMQAFENAAKALDCQLEFIDLGFEDAIQAAKNLSPSTCDVILSRGLIDIMRHHTSIPIIPITFSVWDLVQALHPYVGKVSNAVFCRYGTAPLPNLAMAEEMLGIRIKEYLYTTHEQMRLHCMHLNPHEVDLFIARNPITTKFAASKGFSILELIEGKVAAKRSLAEAANLASIRREEQCKAEYFRAILDAIDEGIVAKGFRGAGLKARKIIALSELIEGKVAAKRSLAEAANLASIRRAEQCKAEYSRAILDAINVINTSNIFSIKRDKRNKRNDDFCIFEQIAGITSRETAITLAENYGGIRIYIPKKAKINNPLVKSIGIDNLEKIRHEIGCGYVVIPSKGFRGAELKARKIIALLEEGKWTVKQIALKVECCERTVWLHKKKWLHAKAISLKDEK